MKFMAEYEEHLVFIKGFASTSELKLKEKKETFRERKRN